MSNGNGNGSQVATELTRLVETTGLDRSKVLVRDVDWGIYFKQGVLISLSIHQCIAASATTLEDLGVRPASEEEAAAIKRTQIVGGYSALVPRRVMGPIDTMAEAGRKNLRKLSYDLAEIGMGRFVPATAFRAWEAENARLRADYLRQADYIYDNWEALRRETEVDLLIRGRGNYQRLVGSGIRIEEPIEVYASSFVKRKMARLQTASVARGKFTWDYSAEYAPLGDAVEAALRDLIQLGESGDPMLRALAQSAERKAANGLQQLAEQLTGQFRTRVYNVVLDCLTMMDSKNGELQRNSTSQLKRLYQAFNEMVFWPDAEMEQRMRQLKGLLDTDSDYRDDGEVRTVLERLGTESRAYLLSIDMPPERSGANLGIPDQPLLLSRPEVRGEEARTIGTGLAIPAPVGARGE